MKAYDCMNPQDWELTLTRQLALDREVLVLRHVPETEAAKARPAPDEDAPSVCEGHGVGPPSSHLRGGKGVHAGEG